VTALLNDSNFVGKNNWTLVRKQTGSGVFNRHFAASSETLLNDRKRRSKDLERGKIE
jgi:hypothetical protein